ncbi:hypothetical protein P5667_15665 [Bacillus velezensis]|uniref:hypothetical protein n=1 Tax=Bacillus velezensis TaxID=492670 RepID=UPI00279A0819|nr:hypothetical protein [Bacillus velezensis]WEY80401.1 hypothetical protein P5667_15665 [Bacillus velezensis]
MKFGTHKSITVHFNELEDITIPAENVRSLVVTGVTDLFRCAGGLFISEKGCDSFQLILDAREEFESIKKDYVTEVSINHDENHTVKIKMPYESNGNDENKNLYQETITKHDGIIGVFIDNEPVMKTGGMFDNE